MIAWAVSTVGASVVKTNTQPARNRLSAVGVPFLWRWRHCWRAGSPAPRSNDRRAPTRAPHAGLMPLDHHLQRPDRGLGWRFNAPAGTRDCPVVVNSTTLKGLSRTMTAAPRCTVSWMPWAWAYPRSATATSPAPSVKCFRVSPVWTSVTRTSTKTKRPQVHHDMEAIVGACGPRRLNAAPVNDQKAQRLGQRRPHRGGKHALKQRVHPRTTGAKALRHGLIRDRFIEGRPRASDFAQSFI